MNKQPKILVLPGMGDIYWVLVKLESFIKKHNLEKPILYTWELQPHKRDRSADYIKRVPFVEYGGGWVRNQLNVKEFEDIYFNNIWKVENFAGFDYLLSGNGLLRNGNSLESHGLEEYDTNWFFQLSPSVEENKARANYKRLGDYILVYFSNAEMYRKWTQEISILDIYQILHKIHKETGYKVALSGCDWDKEFNNKLKKMDNDDFLIDLVGDTTINQLFALIQESKGMVGWCGGNTIMSVYFKKPTVIIWSEYFPNKGFYEYSVPPESFGDWHEYEIAKRGNADKIANTMISLLKKDFYEKQLELYINGGMPELSILNELLSQHNGKVAIDIGANIGEVSYFFAKNPNIETVLAFEPKKEEFDKLTKLSVMDVISYNVALSDTESTTILITPYNLDGKQNTGLSSLEHDWIEMMQQMYPETLNEETSECIVNLKTLDSYVFDDVKIIKIDVEGHELKVLNGASDTINRNKPIIIIEIFNKNTDEIWNTLIEYGYQGMYFDVTTKKLKNAESYGDTPKGIFNFIFLPKDNT